ncbi:TPA: hypothetical protein KQG73_004139, partial [Clostridioides difficile]|nr:hypothetical protein [Clostridioides difficile]HBG5582393.1 hypothetical protein [Clostridioides difficile]
MLGAKKEKEFNLLSFNEKKIEKHKCKNYHNDSSKDKYKYSQSEFIAATLKEADDMNEEERRILEAEKRILETEKRVHQDNKEVKESIDKQFNDIKGIFKEYKNDLDKDRIELKNDLARERA